MSDSFPFGIAPLVPGTYYQVTYEEPTSNIQHWDYSTEERARDAKDFYEGSPRAKNVRLFKVTREELL